MINNRAKFECRHVLYCDLLGFSAYSLSNFFEPARCFRLFQALDKMVAQSAAKIDRSVPDHQTKRVPDYVVNPETIYFSDAIVISTPSTNLDAIWLCQAAAMIQNQMCLHGFLVRGSIVTGDVYHSENTLFGPAIAEAVALEKPRSPPVIVVSSETQSVFDRRRRRRTKKLLKSGNIS
jgi:hypothetical protein